MSAGDVSVIVEETGWKKSGVALARVKAAARVALARGINERRSANSPQLTVLLANDERLRALNAQFRGKDAPTNVLSFPATGADGYLGDIAIALEISAREAAAAGIDLEAHTLHLAVHGVLHLLGYDHVRNSEARVMERLETAILDELGIPSPYARAAATR